MNAGSREEVAKTRGAVQEVRAQMNGIQGGNVWQTGTRGEGQNKLCRRSQVSGEEH